eukprot:scaffold866_cov18-Tisochrysis_lutea.AAC.2
MPYNQATHAMAVHPRQVAYVFNVEAVCVAPEELLKGLGYRPIKVSLCLPLNPKNTYRLSMCARLARDQFASLVPIARLR